MKSKKKVLVTLLCAALLVFASVMGTLAYLQSKTAVATNTFTVGTITATLDETDVDEYGVPIADAAPVTGNEYKLVPNKTYTKDPTIHIKEGSEECYVFVKVDNGLSTAEKAGDTTIAAQMIANGWENLSGNVYYLTRTIDASKSDIDVPVFGTFTVDGDAVVANFATAKIEVTGYAVQTEGFANAKAAWAATYGAPAL